METNYKGIDYSLGMSNKDKETGIRYGVISQNEVLQAWADSSEPYYGEEAEQMTDEEWENADCLEPISFYYEEEGYIAECGQDGDIFITKSPFFTYGQFCSPCAPGAIYLMNPLDESSRDENNKAYCFGHDWFEEGKASYPVFSIETGKEINP
jgi:hypothetical protein